MFLLLLLFHVVLLHHIIFLIPLNVALTDLCLFKIFITTEVQVQLQLLQRLLGRLFFLDLIFSSLSPSGDVGGGRLVTNWPGNVAPRVD